MKLMLSLLCGVALATAAVAAPGTNGSQNLYRDTIAILTANQMADPTIQMETMSPRSLRVIIVKMVTDGKYNKDHAGKISQAIAGRVLQEDQYEQVTVVFKVVDTEFVNNNGKIEARYRENVGQRVVVDMQRPKEKGNAPQHPVPPGPSRV